MAIKKSKVVAMTTICVVAVLVLIMIAWNVYLNAYADGKTFDNIEDLKNYEFALLLASSPDTEADGHNYYYDNRINAAEEILKSGKIQYLIVCSGDYTKPYKEKCEEPSVVYDSLVARHLIPNMIVTDYDGVSTMQAIAKARQGYELDSVLIISQKAQNQRAIYLAKTYGMKAVGYDAQPSPVLLDRIKYYVCEGIDRIKLLFTVIFGTKPKYERLENLVYYHCHSINGMSGNQERDTIVGNFTGHSIDTIYVYTKCYYPDTTKNGDICEYYAKSNNPELPTIELWGYKYQPLLIYEGDLDGDGKDEWGSLSTAECSQWRYYSVLTLVDHEWRYLIGPSIYAGSYDILATHEMTRDSGIDLVEKGDRKGYVKVNYIKYGPIFDYMVHDTIVPATYTKIEDR